MSTLDTSKLTSYEEIKNLLLNNKLLSYTLSVHQYVNNCNKFIIFTDHEGHIYQTLAQIHDGHLLPKNFSSSNILQHHAATTNRQNELKLTKIKYIDNNIYRRNDVAHQPTNKTKTYVNTSKKPSTKEEHIKSAKSLLNSTAKVIRQKFILCDKEYIIPQRGDILQVNFKCMKEIYMIVTYVDNATQMYYHGVELQSKNSNPTTRHDFDLDVSSNILTINPKDKNRILNYKIFV